MGLHSWRGIVSSVVPCLNLAFPGLVRCRIFDWLTWKGVWKEKGDDGVAATSQSPHPPTCQGWGWGKGLGGGSEREGGGSSLRVFFPLPTVSPPSLSAFLSFSLPAAASVPIAPGLPRSLSIHHAGYFHSDVLRYHRPGHLVLHHLSALASREPSWWGGGHCGGEGWSPEAQQPARPLPSGLVLLIIRSSLRLLVPQFDQRLLFGSSP